MRILLGWVYHGKSWWRFEQGSALNDYQDIAGNSRELRLRLIKVRAEATAARLEARAAELELMLLANQADARMVSGDGQSPTTADASAVVGVNRIAPSRPLGSEPADALIAAIRRLAQPAGTEASNTSRSVDDLSGRDVTLAVPEGWSGFLAGLREREVDQAGLDIGASDGVVLRSDRPQQDRGVIEMSGPVGPIVSVSQPETSPEAMSAIVMPAEAMPAEAMPAIAMPAIAMPNGDPASGGGSAGEAVSHVEPCTKVGPRTASKSAASDVINHQSDGTEGKSAPRGEPKSVGDFGLVQKAVRHQGPQTGLKSLEIACPEDGDADLEAKRLRPAGWMVSTAAHVVILLLLGLLTLSAPKPRDQLSFAGSTAEAAEPSVESFTIEAFDAVPEDSQPAPAETALDISPVGEIAVSEVSFDLPAAPQTPMPNDLLADRPSGMTSLSSAASRGDSPTKVQFAGIDGGGSHFVYLVDSSNSMKNFNEARMELLRSVDSLQPDQRFYVVFYDQKPSYMRISDPQADEEASVRATPANKLALRRWAMAVQQDKGLSPVDVLRFAFELRPDVIFLLSDGQFSEKTEAVIKERNLQENLFGESGPISIIHTIRYPGYSTGEAQKAEVQMRRIAEANGGQYRNVVVN